MSHRWKPHRDAHQLFLWIWVIITLYLDTILLLTNLLLHIIIKSRPGCADPDDRSALQRAKANVELKYSVVGVFEQRNLSLAVMEAFMPRWFANVFDHLDPEDVPLANPHPDTDEEVAAELRSRLKLDYEFYSFVLQRLQLQQQSLKL